MEPSEQEPGTPVPQRRPWLIVTFVLALVSTVSWWYWPRGDAKFVGKWSAHTFGRPKPDAIMTLRSNGSSTWTFPTLPGKSSYTIWEADQKDLRFGLRSFTIANTTLLATQSWLNSHSPVAIELNENPWEIVSVSPEVIELVRAASRNSKRPITLTLRRIPG